MNRFREQSLPTNDQFYNILSNSKCTNEDYEHAQTVSETFKSISPSTSITGLLLKLFKSSN
ncbi:hypothetical protein FF38_01123 [Lucilia cuprina]|uniref:Uncharacterized protein n=1 Tax=Lucilia cuprina TaxID=7375 RepID=A0A0L0BT69_LUCCU|nr:hypothetical protein FF38_01123 [Lucilia cuprina]